MNDGGTIEDPIEDDGEKGEFPVEPVNDSLWETRIILTAKQDVKISPTQTMQETKTYDVSDFLNQAQLDHILDCIQPINEI